MDLFAQYRQEAQERRERSRSLGTLVVFFLILCALLWMLFQGVTQDRDFLRGDELFARQRFQEALGYYLRSEQQTSWGARPRLTYRIAISYERLGQGTRAGDYFLKLQKENPSSEWTQKAQEGFSRVLTELEKPPPGDPKAEGTSLVQARKARHKEYNRLLIAVKENRSGVSAELEQAYQEYKRTYQAYVREIQQGLAKLDSDGI